ncbi:hypothetical protein D3C72_2321650 [compost metagenome]
MGHVAIKQKGKQLLKCQQFIFSPKRISQGWVSCIYMAVAMWLVAQKVTLNLLLKSDMQLKHKSGYLNIV